jgi:hypothetical protein
MALPTVSKRSKDMASNPIANAHEERAQPEKGDGDTNDDYFGSHDFQSVGMDLREAPNAPCVPNAFSAELCGRNKAVRAGAHGHAGWIVHARMAS